MKLAEDGKVSDKLLRFGPDAVPDGVELLADEDVEGAEEGVFDGEVFDFELCRGVSERVEGGDEEPTKVLERLISESVASMHSMTAVWMSRILSVRGW